MPFARTIGDLLATPPPEHLYHYTSIAGIEGILSSKTLRATKLQYMNDRAELKHALGLARNLLWERARAVESDPGYNEYLRYLSDAVERIEGIHVYVFCLSEERNLLSQWRAYCPPGGGYCLGLPSHALKQLYGTQGLVLGRCTYDENEQRAVLENALAPIVALYNSTPRAPGQTPKDFAEANTPRLFGDLLRVAPFMKDRAFSEEKEWRVVSTPLPDGHPAVSFRQTATMLVPYLEMKLTGAHGFPAVQLVLGPNHNQELAAASLNAFLHKCGVKWSHFERSQIPFRQL